MLASWKVKFHIGLKTVTLLSLAVLRMIMMSTLGIGSITQRWFCEGENDQLQWNGIPFYRWTCLANLLVTFSIVNGGWGIYDQNENEHIWGIWQMDREQSILKLLNTSESLILNTHTHYSSWISSFSHSCLSWFCFSPPSSVCSLLLPSLYFSTTQDLLSLPVPVFCLCLIFLCFSCYIDRLGYSAHFTLGSMDSNC